MQKLFCIIFALCVGKFGFALETNDGELCNRKCLPKQLRKICHFHFELQYYHTMNRDCGNCPRNLTDCYNKHCIPADGVPRAIAVVNRQLPGPLIKVCRGDHIVVDITNRMPSDSATIHWHGLLQERTQYFDGVPYVTQCPILPGETFRYQFDADHSGTYFYHSHAGLQRIDGITGPLIIKDPDETNEMAKLYDYDIDEHIIMVFDWDHELALSKYAGVLHWINGTNVPHSMLVNGLGRNKTYTNQDSENIYTPAARFHVKKGFKYRFRLINSGNLDCPILVSIDGHNLTVISSDGSDFEPTEVESIMTLAGERYDFILNANQEVGTYWIKFKGDIVCLESKARQVGVLHYEGAPNDSYPSKEQPTFEDCNRHGLQLNPLNKGTEDNNNTISLPKLTAKEKMADILKKDPTFVYFAPFDLKHIYNPHFHSDAYPTPQINDITNKNLPFPLLSQRGEILNSMLCNERTVSNCTANFCECTYVVKIPLYSIVEIVLINEAKTYAVNHPFHLHGYKFRVVAMERLGNKTSMAEVKKLYYDGKIKRNLNNPPLKDTVNAPDGGFSIVKFYAANPGFWIIHCHIDHHVEEGMSFVFQVGEHWEMPSVPYGFPTCGDYKPKIKYYS